MECYKEAGLYEQAVILGKEANGEDIKVLWKNIDEFSAGKSILYPTGLIEMLVASSPHDT